MTPEKQLFVSNTTKYDLWGGFLENEYPTIHLNSRARKLPFGARLARGVANLSPLALSFACGWAATWLVFEIIERVAGVK